MSSRESNHQSCIPYRHFLLPEGAREEPAIPSKVQDCMHADQLKRFRIDWRVNPFYLRGDFDADGKPDYAVMILGERSALTGLVMCQGNGTQHILGAGSQPRFSNRRDVNFLSSDWEVVTLAEFRNLLSNKRLGGSAKGEVIVLNWEDGSGYIYWDGKAYRWFEEPAGGAP